MDDDGKTIEVFTDGSCDPGFGIGAWAVLVFHRGEKTTLAGIEENTTHNRMEILAAVKAIEHVKEHIDGFQVIRIHSDSQYLVRLSERKDKLNGSGFMTAKGLPVRNEDLVREIIRSLENFNIQFVKEVAHLKSGQNVNHNREADKLVRSLVRKHVKDNRLDL
jgi:ribonuclease HI